MQKRAAPASVGQAARFEMWKKRPRTRPKRLFGNMNIFGFIQPSREKKSAENKGQNQEDNDPNEIHCVTAAVPIEIKRKSRQY